MAEGPPLPMKDAGDGHERSLPRNLPPVPGKKTAAARCGGLSPSPSPRGGGERRESQSRLSRKLGGEMILCSACDAVCTLPECSRGHRPGVVVGGFAALLAESGRGLSVCF